MKKILLIFTLLLFTLSIEAQFIRATPFSIAAPAAGGACGSGSSNYGDETGNTAYGTGSGNYLWLIPITVTDCGTVTSFTVFTTGAVEVKSGIYTDAGALITNGTATTKTLTNNTWNSFTFAVNPSVLSATTYFIGILPSSNIGLMNSGGTVTAYYMARTYADGLPATIGSTTSTASRDINTYITVQH
jgi:hypothetical protein